MAVSMSVNTNIGAMTALQNLNKTAQDLAQNQNRINTGLKISGPQDNASIFAIAQNMRGSVGGLHSVSTALSNAVSAVDVAIAGGRAISDILIEMKEKAVLAADNGMDTVSKTLLDADFQALMQQITTIVTNAEFNGLNIIKANGDDVVSIANEDGTNTITVAAQDLSVGATGLNISGEGLTTTTDAQAAVTAIENAILTVNQRLGVLGTGSKSLEIHNNFVSKLIDSLDAGIGNLVDADMAVESAKLQSLQVKQQLGVQALSIANSAPQSILSLFRS
ncbi:flagellin [Oceanibacterium hippocampi]|uniref:Flagellin n=1 Tax=Oceanibacterium hippocampi TaxID=745714 RepID=A0A1Y5TYQ8_9PROT|nr:flagellin [Oceanibacterium hippocampi]SLN77140.1 Flagellin [Oceanibacterium hippocampi]